MRHLVQSIIAILAAGWIAAVVVIHYVLVWGR
jgi:hypothetical protein